MDIVPNLLELNSPTIRKGGRQQISKIVKKMSDCNQYEEVKSLYSKINNDEKDSYNRIVRRLEEITFKLSLIKETNLAIQRAWREKLLQLKEKVSSKALRLGRVWPFLEHKGKYE